MTESRTTPRAPAHLQEETRRWWRQVMADYVLESHHIKLLTAAAEAWDRLQQAREAIDREGITIPTGGGGLKAHPAVAIERDSRLAYARLLRELDLDAAPAPSGKRPPSLPGYRR